MRRDYEIDRESPEGRNGIHHMELSENEIHLWLASIDQLLSLDSRANPLAWLSKAEKVRYERYQVESSRQEFLAGQMLVRSALSEYAEVEPERWQFAQDEYGKPRIKNSIGDACLSFNLSHSGGRLVCAIARHQSTGVDIEIIRPRRRIEKIARRHFADKEVDQLLALDEEARLDKFYQLWTLKESYIKARGLGLSLSLQSFGFEFAGKSLRFFENQPDCANNSGWQFWQLEAAGKFHLALACLGDNGQQIGNLRLFSRSLGGQAIEMEAKILRRN